MRTQYSHCIHEVYFTVSTDCHMSMFVCLCLLIDIKDIINFVDKKANCVPSLYSTAIVFDLYYSLVQFFTIPLCIPVIYRLSGIPGIFAKQTTLLKL